MNRYPDAKAAAYHPPRNPATSTGTASGRNPTRGRRPPRCRVLRPPGRGSRITCAKDPPYRRQLGPIPGRAVYPERSCGILAVKERRCRALAKHQSKRRGNRDKKPCYTRERGTRTSQIWSSTTKVPALRAGRTLTTCLAITARVPLLQPEPAPRGRAMERSRRGGPDRRMHRYRTWEEPRVALAHLLVAAKPVAGRGGCQFPAVIGSLRATARPSICSHTSRIRCSIAGI